jgi:hypothetical protein
LKEALVARYHHEAGEIIPLTTHQSSSNVENLQEQAFMLTEERVERKDAEEIEMVAIEEDNV